MEGFRDPSQARFFLEHLCRELPHAVLIARREGKTGDVSRDFLISDVNTSLERLFGYQRKEVVGKSIYEWRVMTALENEPVTAQEELVQRAIESAGAITIRQQARTQGGKRIVLETQLLRGGEEPVQTLLLLHRDLTYQDRLERLAREAEQLQILVLLQAAAETKGSIPEALSLFSAQGPVGRQRHNLNQDLALALSVLQQRLARAGIAVETDFDSGEAMINTDRGEIIHALINILRNAEEALEGRLNPILRVNTRITPGRALIYVEDNGAGVPLDYAGRIFEPFFSTKEGRAGLGLSVAYEIVRNYGGNIGVEPGRNGGTRFIVELPLIAAAAAGEARKVLIVDDDSFIIGLLQRFLRSKGYLVHSAADGRTGLKKLSQENPDVVLLDIVLPGRGGLEVLPEIKARNPETVVIMISSVDSENVAQKALEMGADAYVNKPFDLDVVAQLMEEALVKSGAKPRPGHALHGTETLLVVDDEEPVRSYMRELLSRFGYTTLTASSAQEALRLYLENKEAIRLISLDLLMPEMSGFNLLQTLQRIAPTVKVVVVSGAAYGDKGAQALKEGARAVVEKPFEAEQLLRVVRQVLDSD